MYASISDLAGKPGFPASYNATKKYLESRGCTRRLKPKGKGVEYLVGLDLIKDIDSRPTPTKNYYSVEILFEKLQGKPGIPQTISGLRRRIKAEEWESRKREGKGGGLEYLAPKDLFIEKPKLSLVPDIHLPPPIDITVGADRKAYRLAIVKQCSQWCDENGIKIGHRQGDGYWYGIEQFCKAYNSQNSNQLCVRTVSRWWQIAIQKQSPDELAGKQGQHLKGRTLIDSQPAVYKVCLAWVLKRPSQIQWQLQQQFANNPEIRIPSYQSIVRWRDRWILHNRPGYVYAKEGKTAYGSKVRPAWGTHDRDMDYANQKWEMDGTKVNALVKGGKRHTIMVFIDCFSRRVVTQIVDSSSAHAAAIGLHKAMMKMGCPEMISTDNGSEFKNTQIEEALLSIGVVLHFCNPGQPQEKPLVERVHGTIATQLFELLPGSIGHSVAERKRLEETSLKNDEEWLSKEELEQHLAAWEAYYNSHRHSTIGMSPMEKWATSTQPITKFSQADSDALMERMTRKTEERTVQMKGIEARNQWWYDMAGDIAPLVGRRLRISINPEQTEMRVWDEDKFIAIARPDKSYSTEDRHTAKVNAKRKVNEAKNQSIKDMTQANKEVEILTYIDVTPKDKVTPISKNKKVEPEVLAESRSAIEKIEADKLADQQQQERRAKQQAAVGEEYFDKMKRIYLLVEANQADQAQLNWFNHQIENHPLGKSTLANVLDSLEVERSA